jgi:hypothetical protein
MRATSGNQRAAADELGGPLPQVGRRPHRGLPRAGSRWRCEAGLRRGRRQAATRAAAGKKAEQELGSERYHGLPPEEGGAGAGSGSERALAGKKAERESAGVGAARCPRR